MIYQVGSYVNNLEARSGSIWDQGPLRSSDNAAMAARSSKLDTSQRNLARLMRAQEVEPTDVAKACSCSPELVYRWLNGTRRITDAKIKKLAAYFGVTEAYIKYGSPTIDTDKLGEVAAGILEALVDRNIIQTTTSPEQIGNLIALLFADYEADGDLSEDRIRQYIKLIHPRAVSPSGSQRKQ